MIYYAGCPASQGGALVCKVKLMQRNSYKSSLNLLPLRCKSVCLALLLGLALSAGAAGVNYAPTGKSMSGKTLRSMARIYMAYGQYAKAEPLAQKALAQAKQQNTPDDYELALCFTDLATLYTYQDRLTEAEEMCLSGMELQKKILYKNHPYIGYTLCTLSTIYYEQGQYDKAKSTLDDAVAVMLDSHRPDDKAMAPFLADMAKILTAQGDFEQARKYYSDAMNLINASYGPNHLYTATVLASMADFYILQEKYSDAQELIDRAIAIEEKIYGPQHHLVASSWVTKARICQATGQTAQAEKLIDKVLDAINRSGNAPAMAKIQRTAMEISAMSHPPQVVIAKNAG